jgi:hypothetical protein
VGEIDKRARMERDTYPARLRFMCEQGGMIVCRYSGFDDFLMCREEWDALPVWRKNAWPISELEQSQ